MLNINLADVSKLTATHAATISTLTDAAAWAPTVKAEREVIAAVYDQTSPRADAIELAKARLAALADVFANLPTARPEFCKQVFRVSAEEMKATKDGTPERAALETMRSRLSEAGRLFRLYSASKFDALQSALASADPTASRSEVWNGIVLKTATATLRDHDKAAEKAAIQGLALAEAIAAKGKPLTQAETKAALASVADRVKAVDDKQDNRGKKAPKTPAEWAAKIVRTMMTPDDDGKARATGEDMLAIAAAIPDAVRHFLDAQAKAKAAADKAANDARENSAAESDRKARKARQREMDARLAKAA